MPAPRTRVFRTLTLQVSTDVFAPRPESDLTAGLAVREATRVSSVPVVVDLGTGCGAIGLSVAVEAPGSQVYAVDLDPAAVELAATNAEGRMRVLAGDAQDPMLLSDLDGAVDVVVSNPPFVPDGAFPRDPDVARLAPPISLYGGPDGLEVVRAVVAAAARLLRPGGLLVVQHADVQGRAVREVVTASGSFGPPRTHSDHAGSDRVCSARRRRRTDLRGCAGMPPTGRSIHSCEETA